MCAHPLNKFDLIIVGAGLGGLTTAVLAARKGYRVLVLEKNKFPFHRVCGEYISNESRNFLDRESLLPDVVLPSIQQLRVTASSGKEIVHSLSLGGFGISRYLLDEHLCKVARAAGAIVREETTVVEVGFQTGRETHPFTVKTHQETYEGRLCIGAWGKRSLLDQKLNRPFLQKNETAGWVGVKYHAYCRELPDQISLHNFNGGYCGISKIENDMYCICYLIRANRLQNEQIGSEKIKMAEKNHLWKNPYLKTLWQEANFTFAKPKVIAQVNFSPKALKEQECWMVGDAAGMIPPLCGNGMSMAIHAGVMAVEAAGIWLNQRGSLQEAFQHYQKNWKEQFQTRLQTGRALQLFFGNDRASNAMVNFLKPFPRIVGYLESKTHGRPF
jgi:flavin-dependent dehydrogenase